MKPEELKSKIIERALCDSEFKKNLLKEPNKTIEKEFNISIGNNEIRVVEEKSNLFYLVIPYANEDDVTGGYSW
ncbi:UNVERIFIED_CONTAM: putative ribosomally synthesized peptide [Acetivibrio alkalicellulosi]